MQHNEAGQGTGPHAAAAAEVQHPAQQGFVQAFAVYVDTLLVCSATAFMILAKGMYNIPDPSTAGAFLYQALPGAVAGPDLPQAAVDSNFPGGGAGCGAIALLFFVFTTVPRSDEGREGEACVSRWSDGCTPDKNKKIRNQIKI